MRALREFILRSSLMRKKSSGFCLQRFVLALVLSFCWLAAPLAQAQSTQTNDVTPYEALKGRFSELGLIGKNRVKTYKDFLLYNQKNFTPEEWNRLNSELSLFGNQALPRFEVQQIEGTKQKGLAKVVVHDGGYTMSLEADLKNGGHIKLNGESIPLSKLTEKMAQNPSIQRLSQAMLREAFKQDLFPTYEVFKELNARDQAMIFAHLRLMYDLAHKILGNSNDVANLETLKKFWAGILIPKALAEKKGVNKKDFCDIAGYISIYFEDTCSVKRIEPTLPKHLKTLYRENNKMCGKDYISCNPILYGYKSPGLEPYCIEVSDKDESSFQKATKECADKSPLDTPEQVEAYLLSLIKKNTHPKLDGLKSLAQIGESIDSKKKYDAVKKDLVDPILRFIQEAIDVCTKDRPGGKTHEPHQKTACESLKKRKADLVGNYNKLEIKFAGGGQPPYLALGSSKEAEAPAAIAPSTGMPLGAAGELQKRADPTGRLERAADGASSAVIVRSAPPAPAAPVPTLNSDKRNLETYAGQGAVLLPQATVPKVAPAQGQTIQQEASKGAIILPPTPASSESSNKGFFCSSHFPLCAGIGAGLLAALLVNRNKPKSNDTVFGNVDASKPVNKTEGGQGVPSTTGYGVR